MLTRFEARRCQRSPAPEPSEASCAQSVPMPRNSKVRRSSPLRIDQAALELKDEDLRSRKVPAQVLQLWWYRPRMTASYELPRTSDGFCALSARCLDSMSLDRQIASTGSRRETSNRASGAAAARRGGSNDRPCSSVSTRRQSCPPASETVSAHVVLRPPEAVEVMKLLPFRPAGFRSNGRCTCGWDRINWYQRLVPASFRDSYT